MKLDGTKVRRLREDGGKTLAELAALVPCSTSALSMIETGARGASPGMAYRLASVLGVAVADLRAPGQLESGSS